MSGRNDKLYCKVLTESCSDAKPGYTGFDNSVMDDKSSWQVLAGASKDLIRGLIRMSRAFGGDASVRVYGALDI